MTKRILIASFFFDCGKGDSHMDTPCFSIYWDKTNKEKPILLTCKYKWNDFQVSYPFKVFSNYLKSKGGTLLAMAKYEFQERIQDYPFDFDIDIGEHYHLSKKGSAILIANSQKQIEGWIERGEL